MKPSETNDGAWLAAYGGINTGKTAKTIRNALNRISRTGSVESDGYPKSSLGGSGGSKGAVSRPTENQALSRIDGERRDDLGDAVSQALALARRVVEAQDRLDAVVAKLEASMPTGEPGCSVLGAVGVWAPVFRRGLGRWAYDFEASYGREPNEREINAHLSGKRVRADAHRRPPEPSHQQGCRRCGGRLTEPSAYCSTCLDRFEVSQNCPGQP